MVLKKLYSKYWKKKWAMIACTQLSQTVPLFFFKYQRFVMALTTYKALTCTNMHKKACAMFSFKEWAGNLLGLPTENQRFESLVGDPSVDWDTWSRAAFFVAVFFVSQCPATSGTFQSPEVAPCFHAALRYRLGGRRKRGLAQTA